MLANLENLSWPLRSRPRSRCISQAVREFSPDLRLYGVLLSTEDVIQKGDLYCMWCVALNFKYLLFLLCFVSWFESNRSLANSRGPLLWEDFVIILVHGLCFTFNLLIFPTGDELAPLTCSRWAFPPTHTMKIGGIWVDYWSGVCWWHMWKVNYIYIQMLYVHIWENMEKGTKEPLNKISLLHHLMTNSTRNKKLLVQSNVAYEPTSIVVNNN